MTPPTEKSKAEQAQRCLVAIEGEIHLFRIGESEFRHDEPLKLIEKIRQLAVEGQSRP